MNEIQIYGLLPFMVLALASILVILLIAFRQTHTTIQVTGFILMCMVIVAMWYVRDRLPVVVSPLFIIDGFAALFTGLIVFAVLFVGLLSFIYFEEREENPKEYYILLFLGTLGSAILTISTHFISFFIGLELLTVSLYALIAYLRTRNNAVEAGMKYLILAAVTSGFLLFGMALIYMETGTMEFSSIAQQSKSGSTLFITGIGLMMVAIGFKLALVPFHFWAADVYQGAPSPVTSFIATVSKIGVFAVLMRFSLSIELQTNQAAQYIFSAIAIASMIVGNLLALMQRNIKRLLAYSSIAHLGYLLVAFLPGDERGVEASIFYLLAYSITILAAFGIVTILSSRQQDAEDLDLYRGLFWKRPVIAVVLTISMLSLAGIPLTAGFIGKFMVFTAGVHKGLWLAVGVMAITSVISIYYYLRVINMMFADTTPAVSRERSLHPFFYFVTYSTLVALILVLVFFGVFPGYVIEQIRSFLMIG